MSEYKIKDNFEHTIKRFDNRIEAECYREMYYPNKKIEDNFGSRF